MLAYVDFGLKAIPSDTTQ